MSDPKLTYDATNFLDRVAGRNIVELIADAVNGQEPEARELARAAMIAGDVRFRPEVEALVVIVGGQDLAAIAWSRVFSASGVPAEDN